jgi:hypothetical protein
MVVYLLQYKGVEVCMVYYWNNNTNLITTHTTKSQFIKLQTIRSMFFWDTAPHHLVIGV